MEFLPYVYFFYMFLSLYFLSLFIVVYLKNRKKLFEVPKITKEYSVSILIPAYNEKEAIGPTIEAVFNSNYKNLVEVIAINDESTDNTLKIMQSLKKKYPKLKILNKKNSGKADSLNQAIKIAKGEIVGVVDSDSFPRKDSISKMIGFFDDEKVGAVTIPVLVRNPKTFFEKIQAIEYAMIALTRKLLEKLNAIYVTPGPLALYRKSILKEVGGFDKDNITEDIELTWNLTSKGYERKMCLDTSVTTVVPKSFRAWWKQRKRWAVGGFQTIWKYREYFFKKGILGFFILPLFIFSSLFGLIGLGLFVALFLSRIINQYILVKYSLVADTAIIKLDTFYFTPSVLNYLGAVLFLVGLFYTILIIYLIKKDLLHRRNILNIFMFMIAYMAIYPLISISAIFKLAKRDLSW